MRLLVTGASGRIASALIPELTGAGHQVVGLARSDRAARTVAGLGAGVLRGDLEDIAVLTAAARESDGVIHLAFDHGMQRSGDLTGAADQDLSVIRALGEALAGSGKPFVGTNATGGLALAGFRGVLTETDTLARGPRVDSENALVALADDGVRASVVRLPPAVHGAGSYGFAGGLAQLAQRTGVSGYVGEGSNAWPSVATHDAARLYRLAVESAPAGSRLHAVAEEAVPLARIAETIGRRLDVPVRPIDGEEAAAHFGYLAPFIRLDNPASSTLTRELLGWEPTGEGLVRALSDAVDLPGVASH